MCGIMSQCDKLFDFRIKVDHSDLHFIKQCFCIKP